MKQDNPTENAQGSRLEVKKRALSSMSFQLDILLKTEVRGEERRAVF